VPLLLLIATAFLGFICENADLQISDMQERKNKRLAILFVRYVA
jgi:hypothetical protein